MNKPIVTIGIPTGDYFSIVRNTALDFMKMIAYSMNQGVCEKIQVESSASPNTDRNRNSLVGGMDDDSEFLLQIDADMTFAPNTLERMLKTYSEIYEREQQPFVLAGLGFMGSPPFFPAMFYSVNKSGERMTRVSPGRNADYHGWVPVIDIPDEPFEVDAIGSYGFLVPYQLFSIFKGYGGWFNHHVEMDISQEGRYLEIRHDLAFSMRIRESGYKIYVDPRIEFGHIRPRPIKREVWEHYVKSNNIGKDGIAEAQNAFNMQQFRARHLDTAFGWQLKEVGTDAQVDDNPDEDRFPIERR